MSQPAKLTITDAPRLSAGAILFLLMVLVSAPTFAIGFASLISAWMTPEYSHGPLIPLISLYLFLRARKNSNIPLTRVQDYWQGLTVIGFGLLVAAIGNLAHIPDIATYGFIIWVMGVVLTVFGRRHGWRYWSPVLHLVFMLPLPQFIYWKVTVFLQLVSSALGVWFIQLASVPVFLEGNVIDLGVYKLQVAEACSGLRYLFPILSFSYLFAILYRGPFWHKVALFLSAAPIAILLNALRIGIIGILVNSYGIAQAEGFLHLFEGWVIFAFCIVILIFIAIGLQRLAPRPLGLAEMLDLDFQGLGNQLRQFAHIPTGRGLQIGMALGVVLSALVLWLTSAAPQPIQRQSFNQFPLHIDQWSGLPELLDPEVERVLAAGDFLNANFVSAAQSTPVNLFIAWYPDQTNGSGIHSPEVCLPVGGWEISSLTVKGVSFPQTGYGSFEVNRAIIQKGLSRQMVYYWFEQRGQRFTNDFAAKLSVVYDSILHGRSDGALIRFTTVISPEETEEDAENRLSGFMSSALRQIPGYVPDTLTQN